MVARIVSLKHIPTAGLLWTLVRTDFKVRYHGTIGGFLWALLKPGAMFLVLMSIFSFVFRAEAEYRLNLLVGLFLWDFFAEATKVGVVSLALKGYLITKARFRPWIIVVTASSNALITLTIFSAALIAFLIASGRGLSIQALFLYVWYLLHYFAMVVGFSLAASVLFLRYRDLNQIWEVATQAGFFLSPIIYPLNVIPERFHFYLYLWPPTPIIQFTRTALITGVVPGLKAHLLLSLETLVILVVGIVVFRRLAARAAEYV